MLKHYLYISTALNLPNDTVDRILETSSRNNPVMGITGLLLYNGRNFLQLIEGEEDKLAILMRRIKQDDRHNGVLRLDETEISERNCPDWAMKRIPIAQSIEDRRADITTVLPESLSGVARKIILNFAILN